MSSGKLFAVGQYVEQNWILFSSEVLTALRRRQCLGTFAQSQKSSVVFIIPICLTASITAFPTGRIYIIFGGGEDFHENLLKKYKILFKMEQKRPFT